MFVADARTNAAAPADTEPLRERAVFDPESDVVRKDWLQHREHHQDAADRVPAHETKPGKEALDAGPGDMPDGAKARKDTARQQRFVDRPLDAVSLRHARRRSEPHQDAF